MRGGDREHRWDISAEGSDKRREGGLYGEERDLPVHDNRKGSRPLNPSRQAADSPVVSCTCVGRARALVQDSKAVLALEASIIVLHIFLVPELPQHFLDEEVWALPA